MMRVIEWLDDHLNPIVVKELRQAVRSRLVVGVLMLLLVVLLAAMTLFVLDVTNQHLMDVTQAIRKGRDAFEFLLGMYVVVSMLLIPLYMTVRMSRERMQNTADLVFTTTLTPGAIIRGKFMVGMILTTLVFSAFLPFMVLTFFLRGVDLPSVFVILAMVLLVQTVALQFALCVACIPTMRVFKAILGAAAVVGIIIACVAVISFAYELLRMGVGSRLGSTAFWIWTSFFIIGTVLSGGFFHILSASLLSPASFNWAPPVRGYLTGIWIITGLAIFNAPWHSSIGLPLDLELWAGYTLAVLMGMLLVAVSERDFQSIRVRRAIPKSRIRRALVFCFYSGSANGITWTVVMMLATIAWAFLRSTPFSSSDIDLLVFIASIYLYFYGYALFGMFIRRKFFAWKPHRITFMVVIILVAAAHLAPLLIITLSGVEPRLDNIYGNFLSVINADSVDAGKHLLAALVLALAASVLNFPWLIKQIRSFAPPSVAE